MGTTAVGSVTAVVCPWDLCARTSSLCCSSRLWSPAEPQLRLGGEVRPPCFSAAAISKLSVPLEPTLCLPQAWVPYVEKRSDWKRCPWRGGNAAWL